MNNQQNETESYEKRSDVPREYTWAVEDLYASDADWKKDLEKLKEIIPQIESFAERLARVQTVYLTSCGCKMRFLC